jgi:hypothetical protein
MSCFKRFSWFFLFSKWIYDIVHLQSLVHVLESIAHKMADSTKVNEFVGIANPIIEVGNHRSKHLLKELKRLLHEISNDKNIHKFLPNEDIGGGSGIGEAWTSAKMYAFQVKVMSWGGSKKIIPFHFVESDSRIGITADDIHQHGQNVGPIFRAKILQNRQKGGIVPAYTALNEARIIVSTPRGQGRNKLASSSSSVCSVPSTPRVLNGPTISIIPVDNLPTPLTLRPTPRISELTRSPQQTSRANPLDVYVLTFLLLDEEFLTFMKDCYELTRLEKKGNIWFLYDYLSWFQKYYSRQRVLNDYRLESTFFEDLFEKELIKDALRIFLKANPNEYSLKLLKMQPAEMQKEFLDTLKMVVMHELWMIQTEGKDGNTGKTFIYKAPQGVWKQDSKTFDFCLFPNTQSENIEVA